MYFEISTQDVFNKYLVYSPVRIYQVGMGKPFSEMIKNTIDSTSSNNDDEYEHKSGRVALIVDSGAADAFLVAGDVIAKTERGEGQEMYKPWKSRFWSTLYFSRLR